MRFIVRTAIASGGDEGPSHDVAKAVFEAALASMTHLSRLESQLTAQHPELKPHYAAIVSGFARSATEIIKKAATDGTEEVSSDEEN